MEDICKNMNSEGHLKTSRVLYLVIFNFNTKLSKYLLCLLRKFKLQEVKHWRERGSCETPGCRGIGHIKVRYFFLITIVIKSIFFSVTKKNQV